MQQEKVMSEVISDGETGTRMRLTKR